MAYKTEEKLKEIEKQLNIIKAFNSIKVSFDESIPEECRKEVEEQVIGFCCKKIEELDSNSISNNVEETQEGLSKEEIIILKTLANKVKQKQEHTSQPAREQLPQQNREEINPQVGLISNIIAHNKKKQKTAIYKNDKVKVLAIVGDKASIQYENGTKNTVLAEKLSILPSEQ